MWRVEKHYPHSLGLSACFRQPKATSHCRHLHGYALAFTFTFEGEALDHRNWAIDFGSLKPIKVWLEATFDHKLCAAHDDPLLGYFQELEDVDGCNLIVMERVGCESFAELAGRWVADFIRLAHGDAIRLVSVRCAEHEGNAAEFIPSDPQPKS